MSHLRERGVQLSSAHFICASFETVVMLQHPGGVALTVFAEYSEKNNVVTICRGLILIFPQNLKKQHARLAKSTWPCAGV